MAVFNPEVAGPGAPNFMNYSQGPGVDKSLGLLFEGVANTVDSAVKAIDRKNIKDIYNEADAQVEQVRKLFGVGEVADVAGAPGTIPSDLSTGQQRISKLVKAYQAGVIPEYYYHGQLQNIVKNLRSRYPGYENEIDNTISSITGVTPANAIISDLLSQANADLSAADAQTKYERSYMDQHQAEIAAVYGENFREQYDKGELTFPEIQAASTKVEGQRANVAAENAQINLALSKDTLDKQQVIDYSANQANQIVYQVLNAGINSISKDGQKLVQMIENAQRTGSVPPQELEQIQVLFGQLKTQVQLQIQQELMKPIGEGNSASRWSLMGADAQTVLENAMAPFETLEDAINNEQWGIVGQSARFIKAMGDDNTRRLLEEHGSLQAVQALRPLLGEYGMDVILRETQGLTDLEATIIELIQGGVNDPTPEPSVGPDERGQQGLGQGSINGDIATVAKMVKGVKEPVYNALIEVPLEMIKNPENNPLVAENNIEYMFGTSGGLNIQQFTREEQTQIYSRLVNPLMSQRVHDLSEDNPELWKTYKEWAGRNFAMLFQQAGPTIAKHPYNDLFIASFNPETNQIELIVNEQASQRIMQSSGGLIIDPAGVALEALRPYYDELNLGLSSLNSVAEEDGTVDLTKDATFLIKALGLPIVTGKEKDDLGIGGDEENLLQPQETDFPAAPVQLLEEISSAEGGRYDNRYGGATVEGLTDMTINEVLTYQDKMVDEEGLDSSAIGKYQIVRHTLKSLVYALGLTGEEKFDKAMQDRLGMALLERRGLSKYMAGEITKDQFALNLAREWAALPNSEGLSNYHDDGINKATISYEELMTMIDGLGAPS